MSYSALLFCPDERTARTVTQVLSELDFQVEQCNEPFAAVKRLTAEHFDALVVDCENEQNATLLFKSARNSGSNQASLSIAVVEGQAGVAKAFRIGANLVLTKPINVEQSKGTIRVARGLLRKSESAKATAPAPSMSGNLDSKRPSAPTPGFKSAPAATMSSAPASVFELEKEPEAKPEPTEAAFLESIDTHERANSATVESLPAMQATWQAMPKPIAEPKATALRHAAEATGNADSFATDHIDTPDHSHLPSRPVVSSPAFGVGAAAAAPAPVEDDPFSPELADSQETTPPGFLTELDNARPARTTARRGSRKMGMIAAVLLIAATAAEYGIWSGRIHPQALLSYAHKSAPQAQPQAPVAPLPSPATNSAPVAAAPDKPSPAVEVITPSLPEATEKPSVTAETTPPAPKKTATPIASTSITPPLSAVKTVTDDSDTLVVKGGAKPVVQTPVQSETSEPAAPGALSVGSGANDQAISGLMNVPASVPQVAEQAMRISQGVSQGLLVKKVPPTYPQQAIQRHIQGAVEIVATISKDGNVTNLILLSGDAMLSRAAMDAVKQWKYKPYYLDGQAVEMQTQVTVNFRLP